MYVAIETSVGNEAVVVRGRLRLVDLLLLLLVIVVADWRQAGVQGKRNFWDGRHGGFLTPRKKVDDAV